MSESLKRQFYAACPVWYWPVLWWQFVVMEQYLAELYAANGRTKMTYGLALGPRGQLRLVFLSDAARRVAEGRGGSAAPYLHAHVRATENLSSDHPRHDVSVEQDHAPFLVASLSSSLYLDPG